MLYVVPHVLSNFLSLLDLERKEQELEQLIMDREHFKARLETAQADSGREKKVGSWARCLQGLGPDTVGLLPFASEQQLISYFLC
jgi:hypothetical protein